MTGEATNLSSFGIDLPHFGGSYDAAGSKRFNYQGTLAPNPVNDVLEFHPVADLGSVKVRSSPVAASELFFFGFLCFCASMLLTLVDAALHGAISGTLIVMLFVAGVGLAITGLVAQKQ